MLEGPTVSQLGLCRRHLVEYRAIDRLAPIARVTPRECLVKSLLRFPSADVWPARHPESNSTFAPISTVSPAGTAAWIPSYNAWFALYTSCDCAFGIVRIPLGLGMLNRLSSASGLIAANVSRIAVPLWQLSDSTTMRTPGANFDQSA